MLATWPSTRPSARWQAGDRDEELRDLHASFAEVMQLHRVLVADEAARYRAALRVEAKVCVGAALGILLVGLVALVLFLGSGERPARDRGRGPVPT